MILQIIKLEVASAQCNGGAQGPTVLHIPDTRGAQREPKANDKTDKPNLRRHADTISLQSVYWL